MIIQYTSNTSIYYIGLATYFDPIGSSSGLLLKTSLQNAAYIIGIPSMFTKCEMTSRSDVISHFVNIDGIPIMYAAF